MPASLVHRPHFDQLDPDKLPSSSGVLVKASKPIRLQALRKSTGSATISRSSLFRRTTIGSGVPAGAKIAFHDVHVEIRAPTSLHGGHVRQQARCERLSSPPAREPLPDRTCGRPRGEIDEHHRNLAAQQILHRLRRGLVRHVVHLDARQPRHRGARRRCPWRCCWHNSACRGWPWRRPRSSRKSFAGTDRPITMMNGRLPMREIGAKSFTGS